MLIRSGLHRMGFRFRLHDRSLPGKPDLVFPSRKAAIEVRGCFWHGHDCHLFRWPGTRQEFWREKIADNIARDARNREALIETGWRLAEVWECQLKGRARQPMESVLDQLATFLRGQDQQMIIGADRVVDASLTAKRS